jgi:hypothetical protein
MSFFAWLRNLKTVVSGRKARGRGRTITRKRTARPSVEALEDRAVPTVIAVVPNNPIGPTNWIPFGSPMSVTPYGGFIYRNVPAFTAHVGDKLSFDLGAQNDYMIQYKIEMAPTTVNGGDVAATSFTTIATNTQVPANPFGDNIAGDYELTWTFQNAFSFAGGGLIIRFSSPGGAFANDTTGNQVLMTANASDSIGFFVKRFYSDADGLAPYTGSDQVAIAGFKITLLVAVTPPANQIATEGASQSFNIGSFTDMNAGPWNVNVNWGDGGSTGFSVGSTGGLGSQPHTYTEDGTKTVSVTVTDAGGSSDTETFQVSVSEPGISASGVGLAPISEGTPAATVPIATFTHANGVEPASAFTAQANWGNGLVTATVSQNGDGSYTVFSPRPLFTEAGNFSVTWSVSEDNASATSSDQLTVTEPPITVAGQPLSAVNEGDAGANVTVATFTHANGIEPSGAFTATVNDGVNNWGGVSITGPDGNGVYSVQANRTSYAEDGTKTITVTVGENGAESNSGSNTTSLVVNEPGINASNATLASVPEGAPAADVTIATFTHANGVEPTSAFTAQANWGSGFQPAAVTQNGDGSYTVTSTRPVFSEDGSYGVSWIITEDGAGFSSFDQLTVNEPTINASPVTLAAINEGTGTGAVTVATFTHGTVPESSISATINWGVAGHTADAGAVVSDGGGNYHVTGVSPTYAEEGNDPIAVSISDDTASATTSTSLTVNDGALTAGAFTPPSATEGSAVSNATVFHFTDADPNGVPGDYVATVNTGDATLDSVNNPANVQVVANGNGFDVRLSYTYAEDLANAVFGVSVADVGGASVQASTTAFSSASARRWGRAATSTAPRASWRSTRGTICRPAPVSVR